LNTLPRESAFLVVLPRRYGEGRVVLNRAARPARPDDDRFHKA
jgi:hypothetical protein